jgi:hypothetical protein
MTPPGLLNCIDSIELLSSGRRTQEFSREVILAKMSDSPSHIYIGKAYEEDIGMIKSPSGGGAAQICCLLPLDMTFSSSLRHSINCATSWGLFGSVSAHAVSNKYFHAGAY